MSRGARVTAVKAARARLRHAGPESTADEGSGTVFQAEGTACARARSKRTRGLSAGPQRFSLVRADSGGWQV